MKASTSDDSNIGRNIGNITPPSSTFYPLQLNNSEMRIYSVNNFVSPFRAPLSPETESNVRRILFFILNNQYSLYKFRTPLWPFHLNRWVRPLNIVVYQINLRPNRLVQRQIICSNTNTGKWFHLGIADLIVLNVPIYFKDHMHQFRKWRARNRRFGALNLISF